MRSQQLVRGIMSQNLAFRLRLDQDIDKLQVSTTSEFQLATGL